MKLIFNTLICFLFSFTILLIIFEIGRAIIKLKYLNANEIDLPKDSAMYKLAIKEKDEYISSQKKASKKRLKHLFKDLAEQVSYCILSLCFIFDVLKNRIFHFCEKRISILNDSYFNFRKAEIDFVNLFFSSYIMISILISDIYSTKIEFIKYFLGAIFCYFCVFPFLILLVLVLIRKLGIQIILACYIAYFIKLVPDIFSVDKVEADSMKKISSTKFPEKIQKVLKEYKLNDNVFVEKEPSPNMNAALIGHGDQMRIEIYGDMDKLNKQKIYSVFLHEIGHAYEASLFKKATVYVLIICLEAFFIICLYKKISKKYANNKMNNEVAFVVAALAYKMGIRPYLMLGYKLISQRSEIISDFFAKSYNYQKPLGRTLYDIGIDSADYLTPTIIYNLLRSGHPSIYDRVEYLLK